MAKTVVEIEAGPVLRTALDVLDFSADLADAIPDDRPEKAELLARGRALLEMCQRLLEIGGKT